MRQSPPYAYTNSHRQNPNFSPPSPPQTPHSVPAPSPPASFSSQSSCPTKPSEKEAQSSCPTKPSAEVRNVQDPAAAATSIQSYFRGFSIRRQRLLPHLRAIVAAFKQLEGLKAELEKPEVVQKLKTNEKERLRFNESVMTVILRLDAIEGSIPDVRLRRKEATKMAIQLQDLVDGFVMQSKAICDVEQHQQQLNCPQQQNQHKGHKKKKSKKGSKKPRK